MAMDRMVEEINPENCYSKSYLKKLDRIIKKTDKQIAKGKLKTYSDTKEMFKDMGISL